MRTLEADHGSVVAWDLGDRWEGGFTKRTFEGEGYIHYPDCGGAFMGLST